MRVNELAKELKRTNQELLAVLANNGIGGKTHASKVSDEEADLLRKKLGKAGDDSSSVSKEEKTKKASESAKKETKTASEKNEERRSDSQKEDKNQGGKEGEEAAEPHKKKLTAVFRPQNVQQKRTGKKTEPKRTGDKVINIINSDAEKEKKDGIKEEKVASRRESGEDVKKNPLNIQTEEDKTRSASKGEGLSPKDGKKGNESKESKDSMNTDTDTLKSDENKERALNTMDTGAQAYADNMKNEQNTINKEGDIKSAAETTQPPSQKEDAISAKENRKTDTKKASEPTQGRSFGRNADRNRDSLRRSNQGQRTQGESKQGEKKRTQGFSQNTQNRDNRSKDEGQRSNRFGNKPAYREGAQGRNQGDKAPAQGYADRTQNKRKVSNFQNTAGGFSKGRSNDFGNRSPRPEYMDKDKDDKSFASRTSSRQGGRRNQSTEKKPVIDAALAKKSANTKANKNNFKNTNKTDKKHRIEDGPAKGRVSKHPFIMPVKPKVEAIEPDIKEIIIPEFLTIKELASHLKLQPSSIVKKLFLKGQIVNINSDISFEQAEEIALDYDVICTKEEKEDVIGELLKEEEDDESLLIPRPPVVCVMGHVDHGKTSLLDAIRKTNVTVQEAGGITQHIGAYMVKIKDQPITFLDTPGHEAFTAMRMRGAQSTDIAILVVAADDGVMPQTVEAISHAKAAEVEIIVAVNKIDKPSANLDRVKQELSEHELISEDWGGNTIFCPVSAKTGEGIENLLEMIILASEVKELKANPDRKARGLVIEAELDRGKGPVATVLVQKGTLHVGDFVAAGSCSGKVRAMMNDKGQRVKSAPPSTPVEILGLDNVPKAGEVFVATENDKEAKTFAATFISESKNKLIEETKAKLSLDDLFSQIKAGNVKELPLIIKADVQGSVEAVKQSLTKLSNEEVQVKIIHGGVGAINESDVALAVASNAIIIGFNVRADSAAKASAEHENVDLRLYKVIYQAIEDVETAMKGMLEPVYEDRVIGHAEVRQLFKASGVGTIAGSYVLDGKFQRGCKVRITREGEQIFEGNLASLKRFKDDVKEVATGYECGLVFEKFNDIREEDRVEAYITVEVSRA